MIRHRSLLPFMILLGLAASAVAQVKVTLKMGKRNYLYGENIPVEVLLTNMSGQDLVFRGATGRPWIDFMVNSSRGVPLTPIGQPAFGAVKIPAGKALARTVDLNKLYALNELGNYSVYAIARPPESSSSGYRSQRYLFTVSTAKPYWSQTVGLPGRKGETREYRLIRFTAGRKLQLYVQVANPKNGHVVKTHGLGESIMFRKPTVNVDESLNMHLLHLVTPEIWGHVRVAPDGTFLGRDLYKPSETGDPVLVKLADGNIRASGGIPYDPKAEAESRERSRRASDRPDFIYE